MLVLKIVFDLFSIVGTAAVTLLVFCGEMLKNDSQNAFC